VFGFKSNKPRERFYLLPGQGGRSFRRKQQLFLRWSISVALVFGLGLAALLWWLARPHL
jgi:hypothetical protein